MGRKYFLPTRNEKEPKIVSRAEDYPWSSASAHLSGKDDILVKVAPLLEMVDDWAKVLTAGVEDRRLQEIRKHEYSGRPLGNAHFVERLERALGRTLQRRKPGPKTSNRKTSNRKN